MATIAQIEEGMRLAYQAGNMEYARILGAELVRARQSPANMIPGVVIPGTTPQPPEPGFLDKVAGAGEAALTLATGATGGSIGAIGGALKGLAEQILSGQFGTPEAVKAIEQAAAGGAQALTYQPRGQAGQEMAQDVGQFLGNALPPVIPAVGAPGALMQGARQAAPIAQATMQRGAAAAQQAGRAVGQAVAKPIQAMRSGQMTTSGASIGAAATPDALRRVTVAESLPVPVKLTRGAATRDAQQLAFEKEQIKSDLGGPLRDRAEERSLSCASVISSSASKF